MNLTRIRHYYFLLTLLSAVLFSCNQDPAKNNPAAEHHAPDPSTTGSTVPVRNILFFGTSLTAGLGVDPDQAYPALIQRKIDSLHLPYKVINAGLSGETSAAGKNRIGWLLKQPVDIFVLELGANDGLRGIPVKETVSNMQAVIDSVKTKYPSAQLVLAGMQMPPSMGESYTVPFRKLFPAMAGSNQMTLIPFLLDHVGGVPSLIQQDGLHPTAAGHQILAENVWTVLKPLLAGQKSISPAAPQK